MLVIMQALLFIYHLSTQHEDLSRKPQRANPIKYRYAIP